ncbi:protein YIPF6 isoform X2 [Varanus komodoensis]|uniref:protein YIPF6 isoform X2 n=1 Tax=Varanus komodoensis TaxID=61221 RepID=UPI001CF7E51A|nr:protein YIPF6 isoform X2 [Varanus komodoensis]
MKTSPHWMSQLRIQLGFMGTINLVRVACSVRDSESAWLVKGSLMPLVGRCAIRNRGRAFLVGHKLHGKSGQESMLLFMTSPVLPPAPLPRYCRPASAKTAPWKDRHSFTIFSLSLPQNCAGCCREEQRITPMTEGLSSQKCLLSSGLEQSS